MGKIIFVVIILLVLVAVFFGVWWFLSSQSIVTQVGPNQNKDSNSFMIEGMKVEVLNQGAGEGIKKEQSATVHYTGMLQDGTKFDSSIDRNAPFTFKVGNGNVIKGWDLGVEGMKVGEKRKLTIPPQLAYGDTGFLMIPASATLIFEVELLKIN